MKTSLLGDRKRVSYFNKNMSIMPIESECDTTSLDVLPPVVKNKK